MGGQALQHTEEGRDAGAGRQQLAPVSGCGVKDSLRVLGKPCTVFTVSRTGSTCRGTVLGWIHLSMLARGQAGQEGRSE